MIKDYFLRLAEMANDFTIKYDSGRLSICHHQNNLEDWNITFVDTGQEAMTGSRVAKIEKYLSDDEDFFLTYGDGLGDIDIKRLYEFHKANNKIVTVTGTKLQIFYGVLEHENNMVKTFTEKPALDGLVNGGFFVFKKEIFKYLSKDDACVLEMDPLQKIAKEGQMAMYRHDGFWEAMDNYKQVEKLNKIWSSSEASWRVWEKDAANYSQEKTSVLSANQTPHSSPLLLSKNDENKQQYWQNKNVFVTGCTGLLGSWMIKYLVDRGARVTGLARDFVPDSNLYKNDYFSKINIVRGQLEDMPLLERTLGEYEIDTVFHLAAQTIVGIANRNPISTFESNIRGSYNLFEACRRSPLIKRIVVASSDKAYGDQENLPYDELMPLQGRHPYDVSKSCVDLLAQAYHKTYHLPVCITRCGNFFGGGDLNFNRIVPDTIRAILQNRQPIIRSDGTLIRDYFYIEDGVEAYLLLAQKMDELNIYGQAFNFSNENQLTVLELARKIINLIGSPLEPKILNQANNEIKHQYLSAKKAREILGWKPKYNFDEALLKTIDWYREYFQKI